MAAKKHKKAQNGQGQSGGREDFLTADNIHPSRADCYARPLQADCYGGHGGQATNRFIFPVSVSRCEPVAFARPYCFCSPPARKAMLAELGCRHYQELARLLLDCSRFQEALEVTASSPGRDYWFANG